ncbi:MAG: DUF1997 domain-containing protein [Cyanobacteria bacterium J06627_28]
MVRFSASQAVTISVPSQPHSVNEYLSEPSRLVSALVDEQQVQALGANTFRVRVRPLKFVGFTLQPVCDIEVWTEGETVRLSSTKCQLEGYESFNQKFSLNMQGYLVSQVTNKGNNLRGQANLIVSVDLPQALRMTPKPLLERTGNGLLNGILITLKQRLMRQLVANYCAWATSASTPSASLPGLS